MSELILTDKVLTGAWHAMLNKRNDCVDKKNSHSLDVHHIVDMLGLSGRLSHGDVEGLLQAGHDLVNESIVV